MSEPDVPEPKKLLGPPPEVEPPIDPMRNRLPGNPKGAHYDRGSSEWSDYDVPGPTSTRWRVVVFWSVLVGLFVGCAAVGWLTAAWLMS